LQMPSVRYANDPAAALEAVKDATGSIEGAEPATDGEKKDGEEDPMKAMMDAVKADEKK
jgi:hypothetical protein